jgi:hypothetical protein
LAVVRESGCNYVGDVELNLGAAFDGEGEERFDAPGGTALFVSLCGGDALGVFGVVFIAEIGLRWGEAQLATALWADLRTVELEQEDGDGKDTQPVYGWGEGDVYMRDGYDGQ